MRERQLLGAVRCRATVCAVDRADVRVDGSCPVPANEPKPLVPTVAGRVVKFGGRSPVDQRHQMLNDTAGVSEFGGHHPKQEISLLS